MPVAQLENTRPNMLVLLRPTNLCEYLWKDLRTRIMKITLQEEEWIHWVTTIWCTNVFLCLKEWKYQDAKAAVEKELGKLKKIPAWQLTKVRDKMEVIAESRNKGRTVPFCVENGSLSSQEFGVGTTISKIPRSSRTPRRYCERWFRIVRSIHWARIISSTSDGCKSDGQYFKTSRMHRTSSRRRFRLNPNQTGRYTDVVENSRKSECPDLWIRLPKHKWPKSWFSMEDPVVPLERNLYGHLLAGFLRERQFEKVVLEHGWEKFPNCECLFVNRDKGRFLSVYVDDTKTGRQETEHQSDLESSHARSWFGRTDIVPWPCLFGLYSTRLSNKNMFESRISAGAMENCQKQKPWRNLMPKRYLHGPMTWKVMPRNAWKDFANWRIKRRNNYTKSRRHA